MNVNSQNMKVMTRLCAGPLTPLEAQRELGIMRLAARIDELRRQPYCCEIRAELVMVPNRDGKLVRVAEYRLVRRRS